MLRLVLAAGVAGLLATAAVAQSTPAPDTDADDDASTVAAASDERRYDPMRVICRKVRPPTGTRIQSSQTRQKMCMTAADWEQQELDAQEALGERDKGICGPGQCGG